MKIKLHLNKIINFLIILLVCSFTILSTYSWGRYVMLGCIGLVFGLQIARDGGRYKFILGVFPIIVAFFVIYTFMSSVWAEHPSDSIAMGKTLLEMLIMICILYNCYTDNTRNVNDLLGCIKWSGYIISLYSIFFYGYDFLIKASITDMRIDNAYANVNTIGMLASISVLIQLDEFVRAKKWKWEGLLCIPSIFVVALTQSRKALLFLIVGTFLCFMLHNLDSKNILQTIGKMMFIVPIVIIILYSIISLPIFSGMMGRMDSLIASIMGVGRVDSSTLVRNRMIEVGWMQFLKTPLFGMGIANPHLLSSAYLGKDAYLHNNFIELLAGGGVVGFTVYYSMYAYLFTMFWKLRRYKNKEYVICLVMMVVLLMLDYGMVSYYQKIRYIYLMLFFLEVETLKKKAKRN